MEVTTWFTWPHTSSPTHTYIKYTRSQKLHSQSLKFLKKTTSLHENYIHENYINYIHENYIHENYINYICSHEFLTISQVSLLFSLTLFTPFIHTFFSTKLNQNISAHTYTTSPHTRDVARDFEL